jgi:hypothetical protein
MNGYRFPKTVLKYIPTEERSQERQRKRSFELGTGINVYALK